MSIIFYYNAGNHRIRAVYSTSEAYRTLFFWRFSLYNQWSERRRTRKKLKETSKTEVFRGSRMKIMLVDDDMGAMGDMNE